ncbi:MAG TPA: DoxX family protein [Verrucomicrobiae bacterium]|nr:DoxX family protein [Verrucomicrobiae bacterium]
MNKLYRLWVSLVSKFQSPFLLIIRLYWGWQFFLTGKGKLTHLDKVAGYFATLHIPMPKFNAALAGTTECVGGLLLLLGLGSRIITVPLIITLTVAYLTADADAVKNIFSKPDAFLSADEFHFLFACAIVLLFGPGVFSLDAIIARVRGQKKA